MMAKTTFHLVRPSDTRVDISIVFTEYGNALDILLKTSLGVYHIKSDVRPSEIARLAQRLNNAIGVFGSKLREGMRSKDSQNALFDTDNGPAFIGYLTLNMIFGTHGREMLTKAISQTDGIPVIQIISDFPFPWEWLYDHSPEMTSVDQPLSLVINHFWALNRIIAQIPLKQITPFPPDNIESHLPLGHSFSLGMLMDEDIEYVRLERKRLEIVGHQSLIKLEKYATTKKLSRIQEIASLNMFLKQDFDVLHIACHLGGDQTRLWLELERGEKFDLDYFNLSSNGLKAKLLFLNAAESARHEATRFVRPFMEQGIQNVIALNGPVNTNTAVQFAERFYKHFLGGMSAGEAILSARNELVINMDNAIDLTCLSYSYFGNPNLRRDATDEAEE